MLVKTLVHRFTGAGIAQMARAGRDGPGRYYTKRCVNYERKPMTNDETIRTRDLVPVYSRISWGALLGGLFVTLAVFVLMSTFGVAMGVSTADDFSSDTISIAAGSWAVATALVAFFCGGCVTSRLTAGESTSEAVMYGTVLWGAAFAMILWTTGSALRTGATLAVGSANVAANAQNVPANWEQSAQRAGVNEAQIKQMRAQMPNSARVQNISAQAAWWSFAGVALSLASCIGGTLAASGPSPLFGGFLIRRSGPQPAPGL